MVVYQKHLVPQRFDNFLYSIHLPKLLKLLFQSCGMPCSCLVISILFQRSLLQDLFLKNLNNDTETLKVTTNAIVTHLLMERSN